MSMLLMAKAMNIKVGNPLRKLMLIKLADNANDLGELNWYLKELAMFCECSMHEANSNIDALIGDGIVRLINDEFTGKPLFVLILDGDNGVNK